MDSVSIGMVDCIFCVLDPHPSVDRGCESSVSELPATEVLDDHQSKNEDEKRPSAGNRFDEEIVGVEFGWRGIVVQEIFHFLLPGSFHICFERRVAGGGSHVCVHSNQLCSVSLLALWGQSFGCCF